MTVTTVVYKSTVDTQFTLNLVSAEVIWPCRQRAHVYSHDLDMGCKIRSGLFFSENLFTQKNKTLAYKIGPTGR